jgi:hypothetical protein
MHLVGDWQLFLGIAALALLLAFGVIFIIYAAFHVVRGIWRKSKNE